CPVDRSDRIVVFLRVMNATAARPDPADTPASFRFTPNRLRGKAGTRKLRRQDEPSRGEMRGTGSRTEPAPRRWGALALLGGAFFMVILDAAIVTVALPSIERELGFSARGLQWVVSAYALTFAGLLLLGGRAADLLGRRRVFMVGVVLFTLASLLCGLAWSDR